jgi:fumarate reductase (CoM/CoB) subunit A
VWQDTRWIETFEELRRDRPRSYIWPKKLGVDVNRIEIAPTYHFTLGGVRINTEAETSVTGLYACGEIVGATHGANRLAGNALTECMVFGEIAGRNAALRALGNSMKASIADVFVNEERDRLREILKSDSKATRRPGELFEELRHVMYFNVGIVRDANSLKTAVDQVKDLCEQVQSVQIADIERFNLEWVWTLELNSMLQLAGLFAKGALLRTESRGAHFRSDYPNTDDENWLKNIIVAKEGNEDIFRTEPVNLNHINEVHPRYKEVVY